MTSWRNGAINGFGGQKELKRRFKDSVDDNDFARRSSWSGPYMEEALHPILLQIIPRLSNRSVSRSHGVPSACIIQIRFQIHSNNKNGELKTD